MTPQDALKFLTLIAVERVQAFGPGMMATQEAVLLRVREAKAVLDATIGVQDDRDPG